MNRNKTLCTLLILLLIGHTLAAPPSYGEGQKSGEYEVKAAFLYNMAKFVEWPDRQGETQTPLVLCVLGRDPFEGNLDALRGKKLRGREIVVKRISSVGMSKNCDILFISGAEKLRLDPILKELNGLSILTVGDTDLFAEKGVMINFFVENEKIRFEINIEAAKRAGLKIHSNVLRLGKIVRP